MPELPEVETVVRGLAQRVTGDTVESVWLSGKPQSLKSPAQEIVSTLEGARIEKIHRQGKHIVFELSRRSTADGQRQEQVPHQLKSVRKDTARHSQFVVHLGMTGSMVVVRPDTPIAKHTHAILKLESGHEVRFVDPRRFGRLSVHTGRQFEGIEPFGVGFEAFRALFHKRKTPIKSALLNQKLLRGIGNIYADESLFRAGIRPRRRAAFLTAEELQRLYRAIPEVLHEAIAAGGSSVSDYVDAEGAEGFFQLQLRAYGREGEPCLACRTPIKRVVVAGRSAHYCPKCQR